MLKTRTQLKRYLSLGLVAGIVAPLSVQAQTPEEIMAMMPPMDTSLDKADIMKAMGFAMGSQLRLNIGFSQEELNQMFAGMVAAAEGQEPPANFEGLIQAAQMLYMQRIQAFQAKEEAQA
ncbi:MAG: hypothetical protein LR015_08825, partial [Verrucomicrobia bacterium]|nr:hypothetical protein [Verrucomicrobiota bacterium]